MGYMRHHAIVVTTSEDYLEHRVAQSHEKAVEIFGSLVSPLVKSAINGYWSFFVAPDGSKEGWAESEDGDAKRETFRSWLETQRHDDGSTWLRWVEVQYGDDEGETIVTADSDAAARAS